MRYFGGHLGIAVTALLDGQLDAASAERAWVHVHGCATCRQQVEREGWVKTRLATMAPDDGPPAQLLGSLYGLDRIGSVATGDDGAMAWAAVGELERRGRARRRAGIALVGAGSMSVAVLGLASLTGSTLGVGTVPAPAPTAALTGAASTAPVSPATAVIAPVARVHGILRSHGPDQSGPERQGLQRWGTEQRSVPEWELGSSGASGSAERSSGLQR